MIAANYATKSTEQAGVADESRETQACSPLGVSHGPKAIVKRVERKWLGRFLGGCREGSRCVAGSVYIARSDDRCQQ